jgi:hypothetical protein
MRDGRHPDTVALDLGARLDTRMFRLSPPSTVAAAAQQCPQLICELVGK